MRRGSEGGGGKEMPEEVAIIGSFQQYRRGQKQRDVQETVNQEPRLPKERGDNTALTDDYGDSCLYAKSKGPRVSFLV